MTLPDGSHSTYEYSGDTTTVTDPAGHWKTYVSDALGNLVQVLEEAPGGTHETNYSYNVLNQLTQVSMPRGSTTQTREFNYDLTTGRLTSVANPENGTVSFEYNTDGTLLRKTDAKGQKIEFTYDSYLRVATKRTYRNGGTEDLCGKVTYYWDTAPAGVGDQSWHNTAGRLMAVRWSDASCTAGQFTEGYQYSLGLMTTKRLYAPALGVGSYIDGTVSYNNLGQPVTVASPVWHSYGVQWPAAGTSYTYSYDTLKRPTGLTEGQTQWVSGISYGGPSGQMTALSYGGASGYSETLAYNERGQLTELHATGTNLPEVHLKYHFAAGANDGRISQMEDLVRTPGTAETVNYEYDSLGRLTRAETEDTEQWGQSFSYDGFGNLTSEVATQGTAPTVYHNYNAATNRLTGTEYSYDDNGNLTAMPELALSYNVENRLIQADGGENGLEKYGYDPGGLKVWQQGPDGVLHILYNGLNGKPAGDFYLQSGVVRGAERKVYFGAVRVDNQTVLDRMGTAVVEAGQRMSYFAYGEERNATTGTEFATYKRSSVTGLDYAQQRWYSSQVGRFMTADPYDGSMQPDSPQSFNRYAYVGGDPVNASDPSGAATITQYIYGGDFGSTPSSRWSFTFDVQGYDFTGVPVFWMIVDTRLPIRRLTMTASGNKNWDKIRARIYAVDHDKLFGPEILDCMAGIESRWDKNAKNGNMRGLYQIQERTWIGSGIGRRYSYGAHVYNVEGTTVAAVAILYQKLREVTGNSAEALAYARSGQINEPLLIRVLSAWEYNKGGTEYGVAVLRCSKAMKEGDFAGALDIINRFGAYRRDNPIKPGRGSGPPTTHPVHPVFVGE